MNRNEFKVYDEMDKKELWEEINYLVGSTSLTETDKELFLKCIEIWGSR